MTRAVAALLAPALMVFLAACTVVTPGASTGSMPAPRPASAVRPESPPAQAGLLQTASGARQAGTLRVERELTIHAEGNVQEWRRLIATAQLAEAYRRQSSTLPGNWRDSWQVTAMAGPDQFQVTMRREFPDFATFNQQLDGRLEVARSPLYDQVTFRDVLENQDPAALSREYPGPQGATLEQWADYLGKSITYAYRITLPGRVSGGNMQAAGNTAVWESAIGVLRPGISEVVAETRVYHLGAVYLSLGFLVVMVVLAVGGLLWRRTWKARRLRPADPPDTPSVSA